MREQIEFFVGVGFVLLLLVGWFVRRARQRQRAQEIEYDKGAKPWVPPNDVTPEALEARLRISLGYHGRGPAVPGELKNAPTRLGFGASGVRTAGKMPQGRPGPADRDSGFPSSLMAGVAGLPVGPHQAAVNLGQAMTTKSDNSTSSANDTSTQSSSGGE